MAEPATSLPAMPELFSCERLSARLTVRTCGLRYLRVRASSPGAQGYDSACDRCPVGEHHAKTGRLFEGAQNQAPTAPAPTTTTTTNITTTTPTEKSDMRAPYKDEEQKAAVRRVLIDGVSRVQVGKDMGASGTSVTNWIRRWGMEVAGDAIDAQADAGTAPTPKVARAAKKAKKPARKPLAKVVAPAPGEPVSVDFWPAPTARAPRAATNPAGFAQHATLEECGRLGAELGAAVRHIADRSARAAVADAAWLLSEVARG